MNDASSSRPPITAPGADKQHSPVAQPVAGTGADRPPQDRLPWWEHARTATDGGVTVSLAVLSAGETRDEMGVRLDREGIQPVWVRVENSEPTAFYIPPIMIDQTYYSPLEAAWTRHRLFSKERNARIDRHFRERRLPNLVAPGATVSGFVFTNLDQGVKHISLELVGAGAQQVRRFVLFLPIPGIQTDYQQVQWDTLYAPSEVRELDETGLRGWLEQLPCCTKGGDLKTDADPLNVVMVGSYRALFSALARRGWHVTETTTLWSSWQTIVSSVFDSPYRYAPISPLHVFGRRQDIAVQKPRADVNQRNHMRLWLAPATTGDGRVWVGQVSRDIGVRLTRKTITTHKVDPDMDETRWYLMQDLLFSQGIKRFGFVKGVGAATPETPRYNYTGDPYYTDGLRMVMWMSEEPITYQCVEDMNWQQPPERGRGS
jgi:hypothetical protein